MRRLKVALISVLVIAFAPAAAAPPPPFPEFPPVIDTQPLTGIGAVSFRISIPEGADFGFEIATTWKNSFLTGDGVWLFDADGNPQFGFTGTGLFGGGRQVHVEAPDPIGVLVDIPPDGARSSGGGALLVFGAEAGEYVAVVGAASDGTFVDGSVSLLGTAGVQLLSASTSNGGFVFLDHEFRGLNVSASLAVVRPLVMAAASASSTIEDGLYGLFAGPFDGISMLSVDGPVGSRQDSFHFFFGEPAGTYTMTADLVVAPSDYLYTWGVDARRAPPAPA
jgi:hypothetical protein